jgi:RHS repeat-associated protein
VWGFQGGENPAGACGDAAFLAAARRIKASLILRTIIEMLSAAKDESVPLLAASLLSENSRPGFGGCDSELRRVIELANVLNASGLATSLYDDRIGSRDTGKERDSESGLDYFGARYFGSALGRFTSPDPLMASAHASNPQSWNRYAYALNNPLRFVDPDGMDVPAACAQDKNCQIVVKVNVIYDQTVNNGKGFTDEQKKAFESDQIAKAQKDFGNSNIKLDVTYTKGSYTVDDNGQTHITGLDKGALNIVASTATPFGHNGESTQSGGAAITFLRINDLSNTNWFMGSATTEHELGHQFLGDPFNTNRNFFTNITRDTDIDSRNTFQSMGVSQSGYREGLEPRRYAVPANPEANKPQK